MPYNNLAEILQVFSGADRVITPAEEVIAGGAEKAPWIAAGGWSAQVNTGDVPPRQYWRSLRLSYWYTETKVGESFNIIVNSQVQKHIEGSVTTKTTYRHYDIGFDSNEAYFTSPSLAFVRFLAGPEEILFPLAYGGENDQVSPLSLYDAAKATFGMNVLMQEWAQIFTRWAGEIDTPDGDWSGSAAGVFKQTLTTFANEMLQVHKTLENSGAHRELINAGNQLRSTAGALLDVWKQWVLQTVNLPHQALDDVWRVDILNPLLTGRGGFVAPNAADGIAGKPPTIDVPGYGDPASQAFWDKLMVNAHSRWRKRVEALETELKAKLPPLIAAYNEASRSFPRTITLSPTAGSAGPNAIGRGAAGDADGDGLLDKYQKLDTDKDGLPDQIDSTPNGEKEDLDKDGDGVPDKYRVDTDKDGIDDRWDPTPEGEKEDPDKDGDGIPDKSWVDTDKDGIHDMWDRTPNGEADGKVVVDTSADDKNGDGEPDAITVPKGSTITADGSVVGADGKAVLDQLGNPLVVPVGSRINEDGSITTPTGQPFVAPSLLQKTNAVTRLTRGIASTSNGSTGSRSIDRALPEDLVVTDAQGQPVLGADGRPITAPTGSVITGTGTITRPDGSVLTGSDGRPVTVPTGSTLTPTQTITRPDGSLITDPVGRPLTVSNPSTIISGGTSATPTGSSLLGPDGELLTVPGGSKLTTSPETRTVTGSGVTPVNTSRPSLPNLVPAAVSNGNMPGSGVTPVNTARPSIPSLIPAAVSNGNMPGSTPGGVPTGASGIMPPRTTTSGSIGSLGSEVSNNLSPQPGALPSGSSGSSSRLLPTNFESTHLTSGSAGSGSGGTGLGGTGLAGPLGSSSGAMGGTGSKASLMAPMNSTLVKGPLPGTTTSPTPGGSDLRAAELAASEGQMMNRVSTSSSGSTGEGQMMPPMSGGAGAGAPQNQNGNRKTWVTEDEDVWGTGAATTSGVLGR